MPRNNISGRRVQRLVEPAFQNFVRRAFGHGFPIELASRLRAAETIQDEPIQDEPPSRATSSRSSFKTRDLAT